MSVILRHRADFSGCRVWEFVEISGAIVISGIQIKRTKVMTPEIHLKYLQVHQV